jgi:hypothetical protein
MRQVSLWSIFLPLFVLLSLAVTPVARAQEDVLVDLMTQVAAGEIDTVLAGFNITALGLNSQSETQTFILDQLSEINADLANISAQLTSIETAIEIQTCVDALSSSSATNALASIATVANLYTDLLSAGETSTVSRSEINNFISEVANGPGGGLPSISSAFVTLNIALQSTDNDGIIGACERAAPLPANGSFAADYTFYADPLNLLQYFADYQTMAALMLDEYYDYEAFLSSPYYSLTVQANGLPANEAPLVCVNPKGNTRSIATWLEIRSISFTSTCKISIPRTASRTRPRIAAATFRPVYISPGTTPTTSSQLHWRNSPTTRTSHRTIAPR